MNVSQQINHINDQNYDNDITITDLIQGTFPVVVSNRLADGSTDREIEVNIMSLEQAPGGTMSCNPGLYIRGENETSVKITVKNMNGQELASNVTDYS